MFWRDGVDFLSTLLVISAGLGISNLLVLEGQPSASPFNMDTLTADESSDVPATQPPGTIRQLLPQDVPPLGALTLPLAMGREEYHRCSSSLLSPTGPPKSAAANPFFRSRRWGSPSESMRQCMDCQSTAAMAAPRKMSQCGCWVAREFIVPV